MTRVLVLGDTHADWDATKRVLNRMLTDDIEAILQVGDFGYWPHMSDWHVELGRFLDDREVTLHFADGNHEDHESLNALYEGAHRNSVFLDPDTKRVQHHRRGSVYSFENTDVMFFGGAASVDRKMRTPGISWFSQELPTWQDFEFAVKFAEVWAPEFVVAHDTPDFAPPQYDRHQQTLWPAEDIQTSKHVRMIMAKLCEAVEPKVWFAGHHHKRMTEVKNGTTFEVMACNGEPFDEWAQVFDLDELRK